MYPTQKVNEDNAAFFDFTWPQRINRAVHELEGILLGVTADAVVNDSELSKLTLWIGRHREFEKCGPFKDTIDMLETVLLDKKIDEEERADLLWMCSRFSEENQFYCHLTSDMQRLQGLLAGIAADRKINQAELDALTAWMETRSHLKGCWPYDELESLITQVMADGEISEDEHAALLRYFREFTIGEHAAVELRDELADYNISGICAVSPSITFPEMTFCFTGTSKKCSRSEIQQIILDLGGKFTKALTHATNYLVVGGDGSPCWAFSCYGRKVEEAMRLRKKGVRLLIVHEVDFWDHLN